MKYEEINEKMSNKFPKDECDGENVAKFRRRENELDGFSKGIGMTDIEALRIWKSYPEDIKEMWLNNAFCRNCGNASFRKGYTLRKGKFGVVIEGNCSNCGEKIARSCD